MPLRYILLLLFVSVLSVAYAQQDMDLHLNATFLSGKNILKVKRDFNDPYLWVLAQNNEVYRINSITKVVDNYTNQFSAYSNVQFIDIAGRSMDTVLIATNSTNILQYNKGTIKNIGTAEGIAGVVNSIGIDNSSVKFLNFNDTFFKSIHSALIATSNGLCRYDYVNGTMIPVPKVTPGRIFEASYRNMMYHGNNYCLCYPDTVEKYETSDVAGPASFSGELWLGGNSFGHDLRTAFFTKGSIWGAEFFGVYSNLFWATENGLFQNFYTQSYATYHPVKHKQYFKGMLINKITSIYAAQSFGSIYITGGPRENLLVGSNQGLYFSNSMYQDNPDYTFFHYDELGNKTINDICVNANTYTVQTPYQGNICEDAVWVAAVDGLYLLKPDYIRVTDKLNAISFAGDLFSVKDLQTCGSASAQIVLTNFYSDNTFQWYKDGVAIPSETGRSLNVSQPGNYHVMIHDECSSINAESNHLKITQIAAPVFTFNYPDQMNFCEGTSAVISVDNNPLYQYRWYKDGVLIPNNNTPGLTTGLPGKYKVEVSACAGTWVASKEVQFNFVKLPHPVIVPDKTAYCNGDEAILTGTVAIDGLNILNLPPFQYQWFKDGVLIPGQTGQTIKVTDSGKYRLAITSCSGGFVYSDEDLQIKFTTLTPPVISTDKPAYCIGDQATLSVNYPAAGYTINWYLNGNVMSANKNQTSITATQAGNYTVNVSIDQSSCSQLSNVYPLSFESRPTISLERIVNTTLCDGQSVGLKATYSGTTVKWSTGETGSAISVKQSGTYTATVSAAAGCSVSEDINVQFFPNPVISVPDATLCQFTNDQLTLTAPAGFVKYEWNDVQGTQNFTTGSLGVVKLTVTDQNGCKASQTITITSKCKDIHVPNTFTPNGDGINDKWVIAGLENDLAVNVKIFNRLGEQLFISQGYSKPWDGTYKGKKLPAGVYFYLINAKGSNQVLSGSITVIY